MLFCIDTVRFTLNNKNPSAAYHMYQQSIRHEPIEKKR